MSEEITFARIVSDNFQNILTVIGSIGGAVVGGIITAKSSRKNDAKKTIREKRTELYYEFYSQIEPLINDRTVIFTDKYFSILVQYKAKMKLLTSPKTCAALENFYNYVRTKYYAFLKYKSENDPENDPRNQEVFYDEKGYPDEVVHVSPEDRAYFIEQTQAYIQKHVPTLEEINITFIPLYDALREDIGSNV